MSSEHTRDLASGSFVIIVNGGGQLLEAEIKEIVVKRKVRQFHLATSSIGIPIWLSEPVLNAVLAKAKKHQNDNFSELQ